MTSTTPARRRDATRQRLIEAAAEVFAESGLDAASVEAVCERAGFTRGAFYSNFDSKEELFLELAARVWRERVDAVATRVADLQEDGRLEVSTDAIQAVVQRVLDGPAEDRLGVLLMSEIRMHALRNADFAAAYLRQQEEMHASVARIIDDIGRSTGVRFRVPAAAAARLFVSNWEATLISAVMAGLDEDERERRCRAEVAQIAHLVLVED
ncbi:AcrR family transcriptional regulator [Microbacterium sp. AK009]|uniref:TetR/AcrR family transcriptional regulator n=1 Tax=Microbacterium sp. AK009 TaxID=2723068 RepID=UPI0015CB7956|nr:TetR/AcrR family transcriptional regulator [Microbacterium sp. AK009]NYF17797.1 AcrR family transcriptional regulator [Microbacterium sp. AK009]